MKLIKSFFVKCINNYWSNLAKKDPCKATKILYKKRTGKILNLDEPKTFTEKMQWLKLNEYWHNDLVTQCIDKYRVREYIIKKGCGYILNDLYGVWDSVDEIDWDNLPNKFVIKCNHGCGYNIVCNDKNDFNIKEAKKMINKWMHESYGWANAELIYSDIKPKIICERFIESEDGMDLRDYKIFCSYGTPKLIYVITGGHGDNECLDYYTPEWQWIPVNNGTLPNAGDIVKKPKQLSEMLNVASVLSEDFPIVRVDLYSEYGNIYFGELTFLATGGMSKYSPDIYDREFGDMFPINISNDVKVNRNGK